MRKTTQKIAIGHFLLWCKKDSGRDIVNRYLKYKNSKAFDLLDIFLAGFQAGRDKKDIFKNELCEETAGC